MRDLNQHTTDVTHRRSFFGRIAAMSALGLFGFATTTARAQPAQSDGPDWPGTLKGRHRQVFDIYDINIQDPAMIKLLKERAGKGVQVRVIGSLKQVIENVTVKRHNALRLHVRAIIRDGSRAFVGSQSLRKVELDKRREIGVLVNSPTVARQLMQVFEADWGAELRAGSA